MPNEERRPSRRKDGLRGEAVDLLYQKAVAAYDAEWQEKECVYKAARLALEQFDSDLCALFVHLIDHATPGGEVDTLLQAHLEDAPAAVDPREVTMLANLRAFYRRCSPSQQALLSLLAASIQPGVGFYAGLSLDNVPELCAVGPGADARGALPAQQRREGRAS